jgi:hypothetical protein
MDAVGLDTNVNLIVASLDLQLVRLLRQAMRTADCCGRLGLGVCDAKLIEARKRIHPTPHFEPRPVFHPTPRFLPRPVTYVRPSPCVKPPPLDAPPPAPECPRKTDPVLLPPWKHLPPATESSAPPAPKLKFCIQRPDIVTKGSLIDFFI